MKRKIKTGTMLSRKTIKLCDENLVNANVKSRNDFIGKAIEFYVGYLQRNDNTHYTNRIIDETINNRIDLLEDHLSIVLFKLSVELSMIMQIIAISADIDEKTLELLRQKSTTDVQASVGKIKLDEVFKKLEKEGNR